jgi:DNA repair exonuclease SbcCD ATPase subunit
MATSTGRPKSGGEWGRAEADAETLRAQETDLATKAARLSGDLARRVEVQRELRDLEDPDADRQRNDALAKAQAAQAQAAAHAEKLADAQRALKLATMTEENTRASIDRLQTLSERLARAEAELTAARDAATRYDARAQELTAADAASTAALAQAQDRMRALRDRLSAAQRAQMAQAARGRAEQLAASVARADTLRETSEVSRAQRGLLIVTPKTLAAAEQARDAHDNLAAQLAAASVSVSFRYDGAARVQAGGADLPEGLHRLSAARDFDLPGIGSMRVDPGLGGSGDEAGLAQAAAVLAQKLVACGATTLADARQKLTEAQRLDEVIRGTGHMLAEIAPDGLDALRQAYAKALDAAGPDNTALEDPATLEVELAAATQAENQYRDNATQAHAAFLSAAEARAGARSTLVSAERIAEDARAEAGDLTALAAQLHKLRHERIGQLDLRSHAQANYQCLQDAAPDLEMAAAQLTRMQSVVSQAQTYRAALREELATLNGSIGTMAEQGIEEQLDDVRGRFATAEARAARYAAEVQSLTRLRGALEDARRNAREAYFGPVMRELEPLISVLHPGAALQIDDQSLLPVALTRNGQVEPLEILSGGTREQVAVLTRLAFARLFARAGTAVPVILDDALVHSDDDRIEAMFTALHHVATDQQILVLTCRQRAFATLGGDKARVVIASA